MNREQILDIVKIINSSTLKNKEEHFSKLYHEFKETYPNLFAMACKGVRDMKMLEFMFDMMDKINNNHTSTHQASVEVGQKLFDKFVHPSLSNAKVSSTPCTPQFTINGKPQ
jgi:3-methyladenine DNA glycosylase AlkD